MAPLSGATVALSNVRAQERRPFVSAIVPAHNEAATIAAVVRTLRQDVDEVVVVDSGSLDDTAKIARAEGARVISTAREGKASAIGTGITAARGDWLVFTDADLVNPTSGMAAMLVEPLWRSEVAICKAKYSRPFMNLPDEGGRLTELCARPLIERFLPHLSDVEQPLAGEFAVRRCHLEHLRLAPGYAVDLGILIHCTQFGRVVQVDLGTKIHRHRTLRELRYDAKDIIDTILSASGRAGEIGANVLLERISTEVAV